MPILLCFTQRNVTMLANKVRQIVPCNGTFRCDVVLYGFAVQHGCVYATNFEGYSQYYFKKNRKWWLK